MSVMSRKRRKSSTSSIPSASTRVEQDGLVWIREIRVGRVWGWDSHGVFSIEVGPVDPAEISIIPGVWPRIKKSETFLSSKPKSRVSSRN